jgi:predicted enzyme related to lactoylglutathione lyase
MRITCITVDCHNPSAVARFWSEVLGWSDVSVSESGNGATCGPESGGIYLEFVRVPEDKTVKNRLHLGCAVDTLDQLNAEIARLQTLGATVAWEEEFPPEVSAHYRNVILRDIEGNEFCLGAKSSPG